jgi:hypothetical protein
MLARLMAAAPERARARAGRGLAMGTRVGGSKEGDGKSGKSDGGGDKKGKVKGNKINAYSNKEGNGNGAREGYGGKRDGDGDWGGGQRKGQWRGCLEREDDGIDGPWFVCEFFWVWRDYNK